MKRFRKVGYAAALLACLGMVTPQGALMAAPRAAPTADLALTAEGHLAGVIVGGDGVAIDGALVVLHKGEQKIAETVSNQTGEFALTGVAPGVYILDAGQAKSEVRVWAADAAPLAARAEAVMVVKHAVRGQQPGMMPQQAPPQQYQQAPPQYQQAAPVQYEQPVYQEGGYCPPSSDCGPGCGPGCGVDAVTLGILTASIGAVVIGAIVLGEVNDQQDQIGDLQDQVDELQDQVDQLLSN